MNRIWKALDRLIAWISALIEWLAREKWYQLVIWRIAGDDKNAFRDAPDWFVLEILSYGRPDYFDEADIHAIYEQAVAELRKRKSAAPHGNWS